MHGKKRDSRLEAARKAYRVAVERMQEAADAFERNSDPARDEELAAAFDRELEEVQRCRRNLEYLEEMAEAQVSLGQRSGGPVWPAAARGELRDEEVYRPDARPGAPSFFADIVAAKRGDPAAAERLHRNHELTADQGRVLVGRQLVEARDVTTGDPGAAGFIPPTYLAELAYELPRFGRPFADVVAKGILPEYGTSFAIPKVQSGVTVAAQAAESDAAPETDIDTQTVTVPVRTIAGQNDLSIQAVERSFPGMDQIVMRDLINAYDEYLDTQLLSGSGSSGQHTGIRNVSGIQTVTYTDASPTAAELLPKLYDAAQKVATNLKTGLADTLVLHPRRAAWLASSLSSTFPLFQLGSLMQAVGGQDRGFVRGPLGLREVIDGNVGTTYGGSTNEDEIYVVSAQHLVLMEGPLRIRTMEEVLSGTLQVRLQVFAFSAFVSAREPNAICKISGTGLAAPTF